MQNGSSLATNETKNNSVFLCTLITLINFTLHSPRINLPETNVYIRLFKLLDRLLCAMSLEQTLLSLESYSLSKFMWQTKMAKKYETIYAQ